MRRFTLTHWLLPLALLGTVLLVLDLGNLDLWLADRLYGWQGYQWIFRDWRPFTLIFHDGGRLLTGLQALLLISALVLSLRLSALRAYLPGLIYLLATVLISLLSISALKKISHVGCPWDFIRYGGVYAYTPVLDSFLGTGHGQCYPAGHASGGYAWVSLYFFCLVYFPRLSKAALFWALLLGGIYGLSQQLRGAHFLSHDLTTLLICWLVSTAGYQLYLRRYHFTVEPVTGNTIGPPQPQEAC